MEEKKPKKRYRIHALFLESSKSFANAAFRPLYHPMEKRSEIYLWKMLKRHRLLQLRWKKKPKKKYRIHALLLESSKSFANAAFRPLYHPMEKRSEIYLWKMLKRHRLLQLRWKRKNPRKNTGYTHYSWKALNLSQMPLSGHLYHPMEREARSTSGRC
jgi:hypothetical protein